MKKGLYIVLLMLFSLILISCDYKEGVKEGSRVAITHSVSKFHNTDLEGEKVYKKENVTEEFLINPKNVITFNFGVADIFSYFGLETLGIKKFGLPKESLPDSLSDFNVDSVINVGDLFTPNYNVLDLFNADLIILDGRTSNLYEELKDKYPNTDILDLSLTTYKYENHVFNMESIGKIFPNVQNELNNYITSFLNSFDIIKEKSNNVLALFIQLNGKSISVSTGVNGRYGLLYNEFGFKAPIFSDTSKENNHGTMPADKELIKKINPDVIFIMDRNIIVNGVSSDDFTKDDLLKDVTAIKNLDVYQLDPVSWYTVSGGIKATNQMIVDINKFINK